MSAESTRREFLQGQAALRALDGLVERHVGSPAESHSSSPRGYLQRFGRTAMACEFEVLLNWGQYPDGEEWALAALDRVAHWEERLSVYRDTSEVSRVNRQGGEGPVAVSDDLYRLLERAKYLHRHTSGAFDVTAGPLIKAWGFFHRQGRVPDPAERTAALAMVGSDAIVLDAADRTVVFQRSGMEINLGAIGKGYALDSCAGLLRDAGLTDFLLHGGDSSLRASGHRQGERGWQVGIAHPLRAGERLMEIWLRDQGMGTTGGGFQHFYHEGRRYGHVLDPRTGEPAEGVISATVIAPTSADADALSTAFFVLGPAGIAEFMTGWKPIPRQLWDGFPEKVDISAVLVTPGRGAGTVHVHTLNLEALTACQFTSDAEVFPLAG